WADGGETSLGNLTLLCRHHHRSLHEDGFRVRRLPNGRLRFYDRTGWPLPDCAPPSPTISARPVESLVARNRARGVDPDGWSASSRYKRGSDIPWEMEARVREALDR
ncbi:MAG: HNH endonuclease signature motif containing protein, partial [Gemmatimonadota bacterium]